MSLLMRSILLFLSFLAVQVHASVSRYEYYGDLPFWESPVQNFKGQNPLSKSEAQHLAHVQVGYDKLNRIIDIQLRQGEHFKLFSRGLGSLYLHAVHTKIRYQNNLEVHTFFDTFGNQIEAWGNVWEKRYEMDERGQYKQLYFTDQQGKKIENSYGQAQFQWVYPGDGSVIESRYNLAGEMQPHRPGFEFKRIRLIFGANGHLRLMQNIDESDKLIASSSGASQYRYFYNARGGFDRWEVLDADGKPALGPTGTAGEQYTFNDKGWTRIAFFNQQYEPDYHASGAVNWHAEYDEYGNMVKRWFTDAKLNPIVGKFGFHMVKYIYDPQGLYHIRTELYNDKGAPVSNIDGVSKIHYERGPNGLLLAQRNTDKSDQLVMDEWNKFAYRTYHYDHQKRLISTNDFDADGNKL